jgi:eukaryotic-like serine/threonine-protein kinase
MSDTDRLSTPTIASPQEPDLTGRKLGDYRLLRRLGRGGMGVVYLADQESLRRQVAIKVLRPSLATDASYVQRFTHEARAAAKLTHANIVQIYEVGCSEGLHYIAQEYVPGQNLRQLLTKRGRPVELSEAIAIMRQVAAALQKAGEQGIVHRDVKPENILLAPQGEAKVADFGLARVASDVEALQLTHIGMTMGSPLYMSPEQAEGKSVDPRSDLYSFGATCYHLLAGRPPFTGDSPLAIAVQHVKSEPTPLAELRPDVPLGLAKIVHRLLAKDPADRFASAGEVLRAIRALRGEVSDELLEGADGWSTTELIALAEPKHAATERLDRLLKTQPVPLLRRSPWWFWPAVILFGFFMGMIGAKAFAPAPLLSVPQREQLDVPRLDDAAAQWYYAELTNTPDAWRAVAEYFPPEASNTNRQWVRKAQKGLADYYRRQEQWEEAIRLYQDLANLDQAEMEFYTQGRAGLALIYGSLGRDNDARRELALIHNRDTLLDQETLAEIQQLRSRLSG